MPGPYDPSGVHAMHGVSLGSGVIARSGFGFIMAFCSDFPFHVFILCMHVPDDFLGLYSLLSVLLGSGTLPFEGDLERLKL